MSNQEKKGLSFWSILIIVLTVLLMWSLWAPI